MPNIQGMMHHVCMCSLTLTPVLLPFPLQLIDFGLTKHIESAMTLGIGTPEYMAPEMISAGPDQPPWYSAGGGGGGAKGAAGGGQQGAEGGEQQRVPPYDPRKVDTWAMGVLLYVIVAARYPFQVGRGLGGCGVVPGGGAGRETPTRLRREVS
jgi:serine/threonine protein kinase